MEVVLKASFFGILVIVVKGVSDRMQGAMHFHFNLAWM
jgi:hypothetical protein